MGSIRRWWLVGMAFSAAVAACDGATVGAGDGGADADADTDADTDGDSDTDSDGDETVGFLLRGVHHTVLDYGAEGAPSEIWLPLPIDHATQTPLYVEVTAEPAEIVDAVAYEVDDHGNFGVLVSFAEEGAADGATIHWDGVVLTREIEDGERPTWYAATADPGEWTVATPVADAAYPGIAETAAEIAAGAETDLDRTLAVIGWTSANIEYPTDDWTGFTGFDATSVFEWGKSSCTGYANLATALGRAAGVPTRTLANYYVGMSQQTHYINEFYLGEALGWRRVEPQMAAASVPEEYALAVRIVLPSDEAADALVPSDTTDAPGIPTYSLIEVVAGADRIFIDLMNTDYFDDCAMCDNRAELQAALQGGGAEMDDLFDRARALWQRDLAAYVDGDLDPGILDARRAALDATELGDVAAILDAIE